LMNSSEVFKELKNITGALEGIHVQRMELQEPFIDLASRFAHLPGTVALMSGGDLDSARYHILAALPWLSVKAYGTNLVLTAGDQEFNVACDPFDALQQILSAYPVSIDNAAIPVGAGLFGYLSYELKDFIEVLPRTVMDDRHLPHLCLFAPSVIIVNDKTENRTNLCVANFNKNGLRTFDQTLAEFQSITAGPPKKKNSFTGGQTGFYSSFSKGEYMEAVRRIKDYIVSGHIYQVNLSQRFETDFAGDPFALYSTLYEKAPAPFYAYVHAGDHWIVSTSPERFLLRRGNYVETRPIKGTRPRGKSKEEDLALGRELQESKKDDAELSMIVDLMRNDLGRVCEGGSVKVAEHKRLEAYQNVFHLVSTVTGTLQPEKTSVDLIKATFPGGSITGCPRIRSMEIIDELEPVRRHVYTGSIGYISFHDTLNLSIAIRTATICRSRIFFSVGGGVVYDSDPEDEYHETLHKGRSLMSVLQSNKSAPVQKKFVWQNGVVKPESEAKFSFPDLGVQYGYGFFETIRVSRGKIDYLEDHISRFYAAWDELFQTPKPDLTWEEIIRQVIEKNNLGDITAAVKIMASYGEPNSPFQSHGLLVSARPYALRPAIEKKGGLVLAVYPYPRQTPLAGRKTLNYLYYYLAGKWALENGADEALILNPDGSVSETNTANILIIKDKRVIMPLSPAVLPGIMEKQVIECLLQWGYSLETRNIIPDELFDADVVLITNSLIGAVPALSLDGRPVPHDMDLCKRVCGAILK
jgi:para-aminobenzoate synthetase component I